MSESNVVQPVRSGPVPTVNDRLLIAPVYSTAIGWHFVLRIRALIAVQF